MWKMSQELNLVRLELEAIAELQATLQHMGLHEEHLL
jgi:hypothetical protein